MPLAALPILLLFAFTLFVSATLLFLVQPMIGKILLPMLGGTPAVWNTCMVFFQALLLAGYSYAHASTAWLGGRRQALLHMGVLVLPFFTLGLTMDRTLLDYGEGSPIPGLLLALLLSVGLPFFVVSTSAPLLQKWFAETGHPAADDPYFLYAASNLGSMLALFGYPLVVEPWLRLANQRLLWQVGYGVLAVLTAACALCLWWTAKAVRGQQSVDSQGKDTGPSQTLDRSPVTTFRRVRWVLLAFVPSSLMLGATTYMTTDIAAVPLLWVLPLAIYLLSFILVFSRLPRAVHRVMVVLQPLVVLPLVFLMMWPEFGLPIEWKILLHLAVLFVAAMVCHGELARDRPPTRWLTEFYLWMSFGGVLGGLFNALLAPVVFNGIVEYPLALVLACLLTPPEEGEQTRLGPVLGTGLMGFFLGAGVALIVVALSRTDLDTRALAGADGLWLLAVIAAAVVLVRLTAPADPEARQARWLDLGLPVSLGVVAVGLNLGLRARGVHRGLGWLFAHLHQASVGWLPTQFSNLLAWATSVILGLAIFALPVVLCYLFVKRPLRFGLGVAALLLATTFCDLLDEDVRLRGRSFFGVLRVVDDDDYRRLEHGTTLHGQQRVRWDGETLVGSVFAPLATPNPLGATLLLAVAQDTLLHPGAEAQTYFHRTGPIGQVFTAYQDRLASRHVAVIGLGSGTLASYGQRGQKLTFFEIDPLVRRVAYDRAHFTFMQDALERGTQLDVVLGDARLKLEDRARQGPPDRFTLLVVDAFSSDAIPVHLITREAIKIYLDNLADDGLLVFHISNRYLDLEPVLGNLAKELGLVGFIQNDSENGIPGKASSTWVVLARKEQDMDRLAHEGRWGQWQAGRGWGSCQDAMLMVCALPDAGGRAQAQGALQLGLFKKLNAPWRRLKVKPEVGIWTDDYSNLLRVFGDSSNLLKVFSW